MIVTRFVSRVSEYGWKVAAKKAICKLCRLEYVPSCDSLAPIDIKKKYDFITERSKKPFSQEDFKNFDNGNIYVNWIIPEPSAWSGGHIDIFRFVRLLQKKGIKNRVYFDHPTLKWTDDTAREFLKEHFAIDTDDVEVFCSSKNIAFAHATIATSWQTAYTVKNFDNTVSKFYFVQDYEPYFYPRGSEYFFAENTYRMGFRGITAGSWLKEKLNSELGMKTTALSFSYDRTLYKPMEKKDNTPRVFFYGRPVTPRRSFELGLLTLIELSERIENLEVYFAGWDVSKYRIPFKYVNYGVLPEKELSAVYSQCDMCYVISGTDLSLLPLEIMASNSAVVTNRGENTGWLLNDDNSIQTPTDPVKAAEIMEYYFNHREELDSIRKKGMESASRTSWEKEGDTFYAALLDGIEEDRHNLD